MSDSLKDLQDTPPSAPAIEHGAPTAEYQELPKNESALLSRLIAGLIRTEDRETIGTPIPLMICDPAEEIIVDGDLTAGKSHIKGMEGYVNRILVACDPDTIFVVPEAHAATARVLVRQFAAMGIPTVREENIIPVALLEGKQLMESVEGQIREGGLKETLQTKLAAKGSALGQAVLLPFIQTENSKRVETLLGTYSWQNPELVTRMNDKGHFGTEIEGVASTVSCRNADELLAKLDVDTLVKEFELGSRESVDIFLKGNRGASGASIFRFRLTRENQEVLQSVLKGECTEVSEEHQAAFKEILQEDNLNSLKGCLKNNGVSIQHSLADMPGVDRFYESDGVNFWIGETDEDTMIMGHSLQILNGNTHMGNEGPLPLWMRSRKTRTLVSKAVRQMKDKGYRGPGGFDLFVGVRAGVSFENLESYEGDIDDALVSYLGECNGRFTGQSHGNILAARVDAARWLSNNNISYPGKDGEVGSVAQRLQAGLKKLGIQLTGAEEGKALGATVVNLINDNNKAMLLAVLGNGCVEKGRVRIDGSASSVEGTVEEVWTALKDALHIFESSEFQYRLWLEAQLDRPAVAV